jgi:hypothetical protein
MEQFLGGNAEVGFNCINIRLPGIDSTVMGRLITKVFTTL